VQTLTHILAAPSDAEAEAPAAAAAEPAAAPAEAVETTVTAEETRTSAQDFAPAQPAATAAPGAAAPAQGRSRMSDLEKFGLAVLGGLVVGAILQNGDKVVSNTGDRVVIERDDGTFAVLKDDDTLIRQPGSNVRTETFADGSTRATVLRADGSRIVTIRDAAGRVLRRTRIAPDGRETVLIDDLAPAPRIDVTTLPAPRPETRFIQPDAGDAALRAALLGAQTRQVGRTFSLRQIRDYAEVRALAPTIGVESITFETGSAAIRPSEAVKLARLGRFMAELIATNPAEMFLIEGHTDAVGSAASNLALSDRRAESLALALTEYFGVPPENMVVQGYGEAELLIPTQAAEVRNRRTAVRMISPLLPVSVASR
ncbi:MAG: OmpA family protein, partial [Gemmobacter sp.]